MPEILHITPRVRWEQAVADGEYRSDDLATEGFIHCMTPEQLPYVYGKFYKDRTERLSQQGPVRASGGRQPPDLEVRRSPDRGLTPRARPSGTDLSWSSCGSTPRS